MARVRIAGWLVSWVPVEFLGFLWVVRGCTDVFSIIYEEKIRKDRFSSIIDFSTGFTQDTVLMLNELLILGLNLGSVVNLRDGCCGIGQITSVSSSF